MMETHAEATNEQHNQTYIFYDNQENSRKSARNASGPLNQVDSPQVQKYRARSLLCLMLRYK